MAGGEVSEGIIVLGQGRSGTSAVAGVLHHLGIFMGDRLSHHWEEGSLMKIHDALIGNDWKAPVLNQDATAVARYEEFVENRQKHSVWGMKDPRLCFVFPLLAQMLEDDTRIIRTFRPIRDIIASLEKYPGVLPGEAKEIARRYSIALSSLEEYILPGWPVLVVDYDSLVDHPNETVAEISDFVGVPFRDVTGFIDEDRRHCRTNHASNMRLRNLTLADDAHIVEWRNLSRDSFSSGQTISLESHRAWLDGQRWGFSQFYFVGECDGVAIGTCSLYHIDLLGKQAEYGRIIVDPRRRKEGFGQALLSKILEFGFYGLGLDLIYGQILKSNIPSLRLAEKLGFLANDESDGVVRVTINRQAWQRRQNDPSSTTVDH